jgi:glycosyltransferase involved in cell wall biosynthesis
MASQPAIVEYKTLSTNMKKLMIVHRDLSHLTSGGGYYLANTISYFRSHWVNMEIVDMGLIPQSILKNKFRLILYLTKRYLKTQQKVFHFTNHNLYFYLIIPYFISRMRGNKYGCGCHLAQYSIHKNVFIRWVEFLFEYLFLQGASLLIIPSEAALQQFSVFHLKRKQLSVIIPAPNVRSRRNPVFRKKLRNLIFVGNITRRKGLDILVSAMGKLRNLNLTLDVVGSFDKNSSYFKEIKRILSKKGLQANISFHGCVEPAHLSSLYAKADAFVFPSRHETYGMVLAEAMSFGLPIIASSIPTTKAIIKDNVNGILYETESSKALAQAIRRLASDNSLRHSVMCNNIRTASKSRTWQNVGKENLIALTPFLED